MDVLRVMLLATSLLIAACTATPRTTTSVSSLPPKPAPADATCHVGMWVEADGSISDAQIVKSSGYPKLDAACVKGVAGQKMSPATENGVPVRSYAVLPIRWVLNDGSVPPLPGHEPVVVLPAK